ncbi:hypothetical protein SPRG_00994 [Saprolegnia parasitica CBS 223.65]|uniref:SEC7 domain-containing protein n=1 Tax=Saprolegnia parasitica (strain CBS 223.65) TaxID=695850 RepID=A0A067D7E2_SAPPC|nr:hypothetical protein SPRG_00994 [Saprolegnia parasitica CBS 223.65]KDO34932.1 hypothetical protein SPRG_00994 [Saprolegnia parasitica CBS 223.65]|eukprot:XP_012194588.1 hypothetical protein SPRG_00994 [Saprolegnia parasitica CBS 223.65]
MDDHFVHEGVLLKKMLFGWRSYYCVLRGRNLELYHPPKLPLTKPPPSQKPNRVLIIDTYSTDFRRSDQIELVNPRGTRRAFRFTPDQLLRGERAQWLLALQTAFLMDNVCTGQVRPQHLGAASSYAKKQLSEFGVVRMDDGIRQTLRKRSIHGDLWNRFQTMVHEGITIQEVGESGTKEYLLRVDDPPRVILLLPLHEDAFECSDMQSIELSSVISAAFVNSSDALRSLTWFTLTCLADGATSIARTFDALRTEVRSLLVFGISQILRNLQYSPKLQLRRRLTLSQHETSSSALLAIDMECQRDAVIRGFNVNPTKAIAQAIASGIMRGVSVRSLADANGSIERCVALFLRHTKGLDKDKIGEYLGSDDAFCLRVLREFSQCFSFVEKPFEACLRTYIGAFRLPGESQKIDRMMEAFALAYVAANPSVFLHHDAAHILAFSTIMLNTDAHNPSMRKRPRMTRDEFLRNNRGIDKGGADVPAPILEAIYDSIKRQPLLTVRDRNDNGNLFSNPAMAGWLKPSKFNGKWAYFILSTHCLYFFLGQDDVDPMGFFALENVVVRSDRPSQFTLQAATPAHKIKGVTYPATTTSTKTLAHKMYAALTFHADGQAECDAWVTILRQNVLASQQRAVPPTRHSDSVPESSYSVTSRAQLQLRSSWSLGSAEDEESKHNEDDRAMVPCSPRQFTSMA